jgi:hypothetical protein
MEEIKHASDRGVPFTVTARLSNIIIMGGRLGGGGGGEGGGGVLKYDPAHVPTTTDTTRTTSLSVKVAP